MEFRSALGQDQRLAFSRAIETIKKVWSNIKMNPASSGITVLPDLSPNDINVNTAVLHLLPTQPSISHLVTTFLIQLQNNCIDTAAQVTRERQRRGETLLRAGHNQERSGDHGAYQLAVRDRRRRHQEDPYFDFQMLQRQVVHRFISGKPLIKAQTAPSVALNNVRTLQATKMKVRDQVPQEPLSINQQKRIMEEARSVNALSKTLATLKVAAEFLAVTGGHPECPLPEYVRQELKMDAAAKQFQDLPVVPNARLKHILALWQVLAARRSMLLVQMNQDPFCLVPKEFQGQLEASEAKALASALSNTNLDLFLIELHEMIAVALSGYQPEHELKDAFMFFLEVKEFPTTTVDTLTDALDPGIPVGKILSVWRTAAKTSQINVPAYGQERPAKAAVSPASRNDPAGGLSPLGAEEPSTPIPAPGSTHQLPVGCWEQLRPPIPSVPVPPTVPSRSKNLGDRSHRRIPSGIRGAGSPSTTLMLVGEWFRVPSVPISGGLLSRLIPSSPFRHH
ncbi:E3 ubiquitin-protein ligase RNF213-like [Aquila chrysaetos chrysaetos]|uniref:E3 ubiquitin-protein ligase RNF213-like n=1 Tax=Aquila chrysaetos chrysaetos TaxID=223781 RepID=UPI00117664E0|nr:E3 ubiquitin-protein ligase RNF213-like [Aquila chrysaetos chrysaetos]